MSRGRLVGAGASDAAIALLLALLDVCRFFTAAEVKNLIGSSPASKAQTAPGGMRDAWRAVGAVLSLGRDHTELVTEWEPKGKIVIVTGASSGIGAETVRALHDAGAHPVLAARRGERIETLAAELGGALAVETDVTDPAAQVRLVEATLQRHGRIDGLVNNAGISLSGPLDRVDTDEFRRVLDLNVISVVAMTQAVLPTMRAQGAGRIVNVSSGSTRRAPVGLGAYAATKSALNMLSAVWRQELQPDGIAVSLLLPSMTATEFGDEAFKLGVEVWPGVFPQTPQYVAGVILRVLRTGEEHVDILPGPEDPAMTAMPA